jgi:hypothetical protein
MADRAIVVALANPEPEVDPRAAAEHAEIVATGRSDHPNQIYNVLAFPGLPAACPIPERRRLRRRSSSRRRARSPPLPAPGCPPSGSCPVFSTKNWCPLWRPRWPTPFDGNRRRAHPLDRRARSLSPGPGGQQRKERADRSPTHSFRCHFAPSPALPGPAGGAGKLAGRLSPERGHRLLLSAACRESEPQQDLCPAVFAAVEFVVTFRGVVEVEFVRDKERRVGAAGDDEVA